MIMGNLFMIRGKIVLVPFPFDDFSFVKVRPAVCLTEPVGQHRHVVLAFISSQMPVDLQETDIVLDSTHADFTSTGLRATSVIRLHRMMTVTASLFKRELGELSHKMRDEMDNKLKKLFALKL